MLDPLGGGLVEAAGALFGRFVHAIGVEPDGFEELGEVVGAVLAGEVGDWARALAPAAVAGGCFCGGGGRGVGVLVALEAAGDEPGDAAVGPSGGEGGFGEGAEGAARER